MRNALIVEDNRISAMVFSGFMEELGWHAKIAPNGREALDELLRNKYDLVLVDLHMPVMTGFEVTEYIRRLYPDVVVIVITASSSLQEHRQVTAAGAAEVLVKPISGNILKASVSKFFPYDDSPTGL